MSKNTDQTDDEETLSQQRVQTLYESILNGFTVAARMPLFGLGQELFNVNSKYSSIVENFKNRIFTLQQTLFRNGGYSFTRNIQYNDSKDLKLALDFILDRSKIDLDRHESDDRDPQGRNKDGMLKYASNVHGSGISRRYSNLTKSSDSPINPPKQIITKPQLAFKESIINDDVPFVLKLRIKHNELKQESRHGMMLRGAKEQREWPSDMDTSQEHPYHNEILNLKVPDRQLSFPSSAQKFKSLDETPLTLVATEGALKELVNVLNNVSEFAVDLEHNSHRSFLGITCLLQISTRDEDYIVDPFPIWNSMPLLNEPFTNPNILKVFHGADCDIVWLQRDFGIYVVNMLDTGVIMRLLEYPKQSLQVLVHTYCNVLLSKILQSADWRARPLDEQRLKYARSDTHYLLYCCDRLCEAVIKHGTLDLLDVYDQCKPICLRKFEQPRFNPNGFSILLKKRLNNQQIHAMRLLWKWRDQTARAEDESLSFVLPSHMLYHISEVLPREVSGITACCSPVPPLVQRDLFLIHKLIKVARDLPLNQTKSLFKSELGESIFLEAVRSNQQKVNQYTKEFARLDCRFDQSEFKIEDNRPEIDTRFKQLFNDELKMASGGVVTPILPFKSFMPKQKQAKRHKLAQQSILETMKKFATPYESYLVEMESKAEVEEPPVKRKKMVHSTINTTV